MSGLAPVRWQGAALINGPTGMESIIGRPMVIMTLPFEFCPPYRPPEQSPERAPASHDWSCRSITLDPGGEPPNVYIVSRTIIDASPQLRGLARFMILLVVPSQQGCTPTATSSRPAQGPNEDMQCRHALLTIR